jgi:hypothetical protein
MILRCAVCILLMTATTRADWKRYLNARDGSEEVPNDSPPAHDLAYFRHHPCARSNPSDRILPCADTPSEIEDRLTTHTTVRLVGRIDAFTVYELLYFSSAHKSQPYLRSVLVETSPNQLHEIHLQEADGSGMTLFPAEILKAGQQSIIRLKFDDGGMYHIFYEDYFVVSPAGAALLDFKPVFDAADRAAPHGMSTYQPMSRFDFAALIFHIQTEKDDPNVSRKMKCCEGRVEVPFTIQGGRVLAGTAKYFPE